MGRPPEEQSFLIYGAVQGHEDRIASLEKKAWWDKGISGFFGLIGGAIVMVGKLTLWK